MPVDEGGRLPAVRADVRRPPVSRGPARRAKGPPVPGQGRAAGALPTPARAQQVRTAAAHRRPVRGHHRRPAQRGTCFFFVILLLSVHTATYFFLFSFPHSHSAPDLFAPFQCKKL